MPDNFKIFHHIRTSYDIAIFKKVRYLDLSKKREYKSRERLTFLHKCLRNNIIPKSLKVKPLVPTHTGRKIARHSEIKFLQAAISEQHNRVSHLSALTDNLQCDLRNKLCPDIFIMLLEHLEYVKINVSYTSKMSLIKKYDILSCKRNNGNQNKKSQSWIVNLSSRTLNCQETEVLSKGLKFAPVSKKINHIEILAPLEEALSDMPSEKANSIRLELIQSLRYFNPQTDNLTLGQRKAIHTLKNDVSIAILPADKGNATVILNQIDYDKKMTALLQDEKTYRKLSLDPTPATQTKMNQALLKLKKSKKLDDHVYSRLYCSSGVIPRIYGLPKIHKEGVPLRPIVAYYTSPTYQLSKFLANLLATYGTNQFSIPTSAEFISRIEKLTLKPDEIMVSFDVISLFTCIPTETACESIRQLLSNDISLNTRTKLNPKDISELLHLCLNSTSFIYNKNIYTQQFGTAMGSPVSPIIANILMSDIESYAMTTFTPTPSFWCRYIDDTFCIVKKDQANNLLDFLNSINKHIKFTMEEEQFKRLPFLDVLVHRSHLKLTTTVYRKDTHTDLYLNYLSNHPPCQKASVVQTLFKRARTNTTSKSDLKVEEKHLIKTLQQNEYPYEFIDQNKFKKTLPPKNTKPKKFICIPYIGETSEKIRRIFRKQDIGISFKPEKTLRNVFCHPKDPFVTEEKSHVVYALPCNDCNQKYIGQTSKQLKERVKEHKKSVRNWDPLSAVADHVHTEDHTINWSGVKALHQKTSLKQRLFLESYEFNMNNTFKKNRTIHLPELYLNFLK